MKNELAKMSFEYFENYNRQYENGAFRGSEARPYNLSAIKLWLSIRDNLTYVDDYCEGEWRTLTIVKSCSKYGTNHVFIDIKNKLWRTTQTGCEFYGDIPRRFEIGELAK